MKQLILLILVAGMVATSTFAQTAVTGSAPQPVSCVNDPLHPIAGKPYDYSAILNPTEVPPTGMLQNRQLFVTAG